MTENRNSHILEPNENEAKKDFVLAELNEFDIPEILEIVRQCYIEVQPNRFLTPENTEKFIQSRVEAVDASLRLALTDQDKQQIRVGKIGDTITGVIGFHIGLNQDILNSRSEICESLQDLNPILAQELTIENTRKVGTFTPWYTKPGFRGLGYSSQYLHWNEQTAFVLGCEWAIYMSYPTLLENAQKKFKQAGHTLIIEELPLEGDFFQNSVWIADLKTIVPDRAKLQHSS